MFFLAKGSVKAVSADGKQIYAVMQEGSFFGELALLFDMKRSASVRAIGHVDVFMLTKEHFDAAQRLFPHFGESMRRVRETHKYKAALSK